MIKYYLVHGGDKIREERMKVEFVKWGINEVSWVLHPNKDELTEELMNQIVIQSPSMSVGRMVMPSAMLLRRGRISCSYKHYLCLQDIVNNGYEYAVIMEDNSYFSDNIPLLMDRWIKQLNEVYGQEEWDILFNCYNTEGWATYSEGPIIEGLEVYPKTNEITTQCLGGTKSANFYLLTNKCAKILYENYIPFNSTPEMWMNDLFRKLNIKSFWSHPGCVHPEKGHTSTTSGLDFIIQ